MKELKGKEILESWGWRPVGKEPLPSIKPSLIIGTLGVSKTGLTHNWNNRWPLCGPQIPQRDDQLRSWSEKVRRACSSGNKGRVERLLACKNRNWQCGRKGSLPAPYTNYWTNVVKYCLLWIKLLNIILCQECSTRHGTWAKNITWFSIMDMPKYNTH